MKYLKSYEKYNRNGYIIDDIRVGDYVKANYGTAMEPKVVEFLDENFGVVTHIDKNKDYFEVKYKYDDVPDDIRNYFLEIGFMRLLFDINSLIEFASTKEELELKLISNEYNL